jgi:prepilin-type N-terminal cleavage/methylation domain-containing protein/prepilin-type processing-associated H-X9-DG protein
MNIVQILPPSWSPAKHGRKSGFTLIELLVVIAIIAILAAVAFPLASRMIAAGHTGKATANLRQIGALMASYTADNNNCLPILIDNGNMSGGSPSSNPENYQFWQNIIRQNAGLSKRPFKDSNKDPWLPEIYYDPTVKKSKHPWGDFGGNDSIMLGLGTLPEIDCRVQFGSSRGTPLSRIGSPGKKVLVATAKDVEGSNWKSSWYFNGLEYASQGDKSSMPKPDARHGGKALCLFADGHTEALDVANMSAADRRKYFLRDEN